jgi:hypothetical protein
MKVLDGRVTHQQRFQNARLAAYIFSPMCSSIVGGFMANWQGVVEHYYSACASVLAVAVCAR